MSLRRCAPQVMLAGSVHGLATRGTGDGGVFHAYPRAAISHQGPATDAAAGVAHSRIRCEVPTAPVDRELTENGTAIRPDTPAHGWGVPFRNALPAGHDRRGGRMGRLELQFPTLDTCALHQHGPVLGRAMRRFSSTPQFPCSATKCEVADEQTVIHDRSAQRGWTRSESAATCRCDGPKVA